MPTRSQAEEKEFDELCDLDVIQSRAVRFKLAGQWHELEPITTERFFEFWEATTEYQKRTKDSAEEENQAFLKLVRSVCKSISLSDVAGMTVVQKGALMSHITSKIIGKGLASDLEKKN